MGILSASDTHDEAGGNYAEMPDLGGKPAGDQVFDRWLTHHLSRLYNPIMQEAIPTDLIRLLEDRLK